MILPLLSLIAVFLFFTFLGCPIVVSLGISCVLYILVYADYTMLYIVPEMMVAGLDSFTYLCLPFFILAGELMTVGGISKRLVDFASAWVGHIRGGLSHVNIVVSIIFSGVSGHEIADTSAIGGVLIPAMKEDGYPAPYAAAVTSASSVIGPIIPPSIPMIIYGAVTETSIAALFIAGAVPGLLLGVYLLVASYIISKKRGFPRREKKNLKQKMKSTGDASFALLLPVIILGGIITGIVTPTEAGALAVACALIISVFIYRSLKISELPGVFAVASRSAIYIMALVATARLISYLVSEMRVGDVVVMAFSNFSDSKWLFLTILNIFFLVWGTCMSAVIGLVVIVPMLMPLVISLGIDPVHFGVIAVLNLMIGPFTPPVGVSIFLSSTIAKTDIKDTIKETPIFLVALIFTLICVTYFPQLSLWLPEVLLDYTPVH